MIHVLGLVISGTVGYLGPTPASTWATQASPTHEHPWRHQHSWPPPPPNLWPGPRADRTCNAQVASLSSAVSHSATLICCCTCPRCSSPGVDPLLCHKWPFSLGWECLPQPSTTDWAKVSCCVWTDLPSFYLSLYCERIFSVISFLASATWFIRSMNCIWKGENLVYLWTQDFFFSLYQVKAYLC